MNLNSQSTLTRENMSITKSNDDLSKSGATSTNLSYKQKYK